MRKKQPPLDFSTYQDVVDIPCDCSEPCGFKHRKILLPVHIRFQIAGWEYVGDIVPGTGRWEEIKP